MKAWPLGLAAAVVGLTLLLGGCDWASFTKRVSNPSSEDPASAARGQPLYLQYCATCHGLEGRGDGPAAAGLRRPLPNFTNRNEMIARGDPDLFWMIYRGSRSQGAMPPFKDRLSEAGMWDTVNYIRTLYSASP